MDPPRPGQQPYLKPQVQIYNRSLQQVDKRLARQGFRQIQGSYYSRRFLQLILLMLGSMSARPISSKMYSSAYK